MVRYITFFDSDTQKWGVVRSDCFKYDSQQEAEDNADFLTYKYEIASALGSIKSDGKAKSSRENGKKGGRPKKLDISSCPNHFIAGHYKNINKNSCTLDVELP